MVKYHFKEGAAFDQKAAFQKRELSQKLQGRSSFPYPTCLMNKYTYVYIIYLLLNSILM